MQNPHILIPMDMDEFWVKMRQIVDQALNQRTLNNTFPENSPGDAALLKVKDVCKIFQVSKPTVYDWMNKGRLKSVRIQSRRFFLMSDIVALIEENGSSI